MKELDPLREALAASTKGPWCFWGDQALVANHGRRPVILSASREGVLVERKDDGLLRPLDEGGPNARAIVLSVNLAPMLLRVAECAALVYEGLDAEIDGQTITLEEAARRHDALGDALTALRGGAR